MKVIAIILMLSGAILAGLNIRDEMRGETEVYSPGYSSSASWSPTHASEDRKNSNFRGAMNYQWIYASLLIGAGFFTYSLCRSADKTDPFSPDLKWPDEKE